MSACLTQAPAMRCPGCNAEIILRADDRVGFRDDCDACGVDLHACRCCAHYEPGAYNECREPGAERVLDKERANRCDWFSAGEGGAADSRDQARADLDALFKK